MHKRPARPLAQPATVARRETACGVLLLLREAGGTYAVRLDTAAARTVLAEADTYHLALAEVRRAAA